MNNNGMLNKDVKLQELEDRLRAISNQSSEGNQQQNQLIQKIWMS